MTKIVPLNLIFTDYLCNVVDDLGLHPSDAIKQILSLLQATPQTFGDVTKDKPQRMISAISTMRDIALQ